MKIKNILLIILMLLAINSFGQGRFKERREQIKALKVAYITDELKLTPEEATKFWPLYNAYEEKQRELRQEKLRSYMDRMENGETDKMNEKDAAALLVQMESTEDELYQSRKKLIASLKNVISSVKIIKLKKAEEGFNRKLLKQYRDKGGKE